MLNQLIIKLMPLVPKTIIKAVAKRYIAGDELSDAIRVTKEIESEGGMTTIDALGEFVDSHHRAIIEKETSSTILDAIHQNQLNSYLSIKPTSLGLGIDEEFGYTNIKQIIEKADELGLFVRLDMENSPFTTKTLNLYKRLRADGFDNLGVVIQSYLIRSEDDVKSLIEYKPSIRLCKGIYKEASNIAYQGKEEVRNNYKRLFDIIVGNGMYIGIATHDDPLIDYAMKYIAKHNIPKESYEFQMLLGVRDEKRKEIISKGHKMRVYVPFGSDWYGYSTRRLKENPNMAWHITKAIFIRN